MAERLLRLNPGFLVQDGLHSTDKRHSEEFLLPTKVTDALNLFANMGILRDERAYLVLTKSHGIGRGNSYAVVLDDRVTLFTMLTYASQAIMLDWNGRKFSVDEFSSFLVSQAKRAFTGSKLTKSALGRFCVLRMVFDVSKLSDTEAVELSGIDAPLSSMVSLWREGATVDVIRDTADLPESWLDRLLGD